MYGDIRIQLEGKSQLVCSTVGTYSPFVDPGARGSFWKRNNLNFYGIENPQTTNGSFESRI